jgi:hypothetical protein
MIIASIGKIDNDNDNDNHDKKKKRWKYYDTMIYDY